MSFLYVIATILFTVYGQIIVKYRLPYHRDLESHNKLLYILKMLTDPFVLSGLFAAVLASICWMLALTKFEVSRIYPAMSLAPMLVFLISGYLFHEAVTPGKIIGLILIIAGTIISFKF